jgi:hypothetical protein
LLLILLPAPAITTQNDQVGSQELKLLPSATSTRTCAAFAFAFAFSCLRIESHGLRLSSPEPFILSCDATRFAEFDVAATLAVPVARSFARVSSPQVVHGRSWGPGTKNTHKSREI